MLSYIVYNNVNYSCYIQVIMYTYRYYMTSILIIYTVYILYILYHTHMHHVYALTSKSRNSPAKKNTTVKWPQTAESKPPEPCCQKRTTKPGSTPFAIRASASPRLRQPSNLVGLYKEFISSPRIDNQLSTWGAIQVGRPVGGLR